MAILSDFTNVKVGDRLYHYGRDEYVIVDEVRKGQYPIVIMFPDGNKDSILTDGRQYNSHKNASVFWKRPCVVVPSPPRRVKKTISLWVFVRDGVVQCSTINQKRANRWIENGRNVIKLEKKIEVDI